MLPPFPLTFPGHLVFHSFLQKASSLACVRFPSSEEATIWWATLYISKQRWAL
jgi:hypothetical protein